jgi:hypothetical protein
VNHSSLSAGKPGGSNVGIYSERAQFEPTALVSSAANEVLPDFSQTFQFLLG